MDHGAADCRRTRALGAAQRAAADPAVDESAGSEALQGPQLEAVCCRRAGQLGPRCARLGRAGLACLVYVYGQCAHIKRASCRAFDERPHSGVLQLAYSAPLAGAGFRIYLLFRASDAGTTLSVLCQQVASSSKAETLVFLDIAFTLSLGPVSRSGTAVSATQGPIVHDGSVGWAGFRDFLQIGPMAGGWDKVAWANKGLPAAGKVDVRLKVSLVQNNQQEAPQAPPADAY